MISHENHVQTIQNFSLHSLGGKKQENDKIIECKDKVSKHSQKSSSEPIFKKKNLFSFGTKKDSVCIGKNAGRRLGGLVG